jgi:hypothetical protein
MVEEQLAKLEGQNRRIKRWLFALTGVFSISAIVAVILMFMATAKAQGELKELRTERLVIVDSGGNAIGTFGRDENGGFIQVGGGESLVTILAGKSGSIIAQHGNHMTYMSADSDVCLFKITSPDMEAALKSTTSREECAFWVSSNAKGRVYMGINSDFGASGFLRTQKGQTAWEASEKKPNSP